MEQDPEGDVVPNRVERRGHGAKPKRRRRNAKPRRSTRSLARSDQSALTLLVIGLTLLVLLLGALILVVKLRPVPVPAAQVNARVVLWQQEVKADSSDSWNWTGLGIAYLGAARPEEAQKAFERAVSIDDSNWLATFQLALLIKGTDPDQAQKMLEKSSGIAPAEDSVTLYVALGDLLYQQGAYKKARVAYAKAVAILPGIFDARMGLGRSLQALGDTDGALTQYRQALRVNPGSAEVKEAIAHLNDPIAPSPSTQPSPTP